jgi:putative protein-disulfide isomerase
MPTDGEKTTLWYFADPMCSWCWGFTTVLEDLEEAFKDRLQTRLVMGGLRPGAKSPISEKLREEIKHHWREVSKWTGQVINHDHAMPEGFVYDTEPPSRAVVAVSGILPGAERPYFKLVQAAFYMEGRDVTKPEVLADLAEAAGFERGRFLEAFDSEAAREGTIAGFHLSRNWGVTGFPTVILQKGENLARLTTGYRPFEDLKPLVQKWIEGNGE